MSLLNKKAQKLIARLGEYKYKCLLGRTPDVVIYTDMGLQVQLGADANYVNIGDAIVNLIELARVLTELEDLEG